MATKEELQAKKEADMSAKLQAQAAEKELKAKHDAEAAALKIKLDAAAAAQAAAEAKPSYKAYQALIEAYKKQNPLKFEAKKEEFAKKLAALK